MQQPQEPQTALALVFEATSLLHAICRSICICHRISRLGRESHTRAGLRPRDSDDRTTNGEGVLFVGEFWLMRLLLQKKRIRIRTIQEKNGLISILFGEWLWKTCPRQSGLHMCEVISFALSYLLLGGHCRTQEACRSRAFITAKHIHCRPKRYTCGCLCGGEEVASVPLLDVVDVLSDATWWSRMEALSSCGCGARPCCATKVSNSDCMLLGVLHRPSGAVDCRPGSKPLGSLLELTALCLKDPTTFQQVLQAAVALRQKGP